MRLLEAPLRRVKNVDQRGLRLTRQEQPYAAHAVKGQVMCDATPKKVEQLESGFVHFAPPDPNKQYEKWVDMPCDPNAPFMHPDHPFPGSIPIRPTSLEKHNAMPERVAEIDWLIRVLKAHNIDQMNMVAIITSYIDASVPQRTFDP